MAIDRRLRWVQAREREDDRTGDRDVGKAGGVRKLKQAGLIEETAVTIARSEHPTEISIVQIIEKISQTPSLTQESIGVLERLVALQERRDDRDRKEKFFEALKRVQEKAPRVTKYGLMDRGPGKGTIAFAKREDIDAVMRPIYQAEGFSVNWDAPRSETLIRVVGRFTAFGHTEEREWSCSPDTSGGKQNPQAAGSTVSYGQRYISIMMWDIITEDQDTNGGTRASTSPILQKQADEISTALDDLGAKVGTQQRAAFQKTFGVSKVEEIKQSQLDEVWNRIRNRQKA